MVGVPVNFEKSSCAAQRPAPLLGQHTDEVLRELGYDDAQIAELRAARVIKTEITEYTK
jgi:crotonobetainyl-CoA:carnitine CoA-transferase CaiB-like acyl-CoA transferase